MVLKSIIGAICACLAIVSFNANTAIMNADWQTAGDNLITQDTGNGLEWLDLTVTAGRSYNDISANFGTGMEFDGWRYATINEVHDFLTSFGGDPNYYTGWSTQNNGLFDSVSPFWGDLWCIQQGCDIGDGYSYFLTGDSMLAGSHMSGLIYDLFTDVLSTEQDYMNISLINNSQNDAFGSDLRGSALVRDISSIPIPSAAWLFGSGLIGLIGFARRKKA